MADETHVLYKALADFSALHKATLQAKKDLAELKAAQEATNASDIAGQDKVQKAYDKTAKSAKDKVKFVDAETEASNRAANAAKNVSQWLSEEDAASRKAAASAKVHSDSEDKRASALTRAIRILRDSGSAVEGLNKQYSNSTPVMERVRGALDSLFRSHKAVNDEEDRSPGIIGRARSALLSYSNTMKSSGKDADTLGEKLKKALGQKSSLGGLPYGALIALIGGIISIIEPAIAGLGALGTAALALGSNLASLSGVLAAVPSGILAIISVSQGLKMALNGVSQAFKDSANGNAEAYAKDLERLSPAAQSFVKQLVAMNTNMRKDVQESFFSAFIGDLGKVETLLPLVQRYLQSGAAAAGNFVDKFINVATSGPWTQDFSTLIDGNDKILGNFGDTLLSLIDMFRNVAVAAQPFAILLSGKIKDGTKSLSDMIQTARDDGSLSAWLDKTNSRLTTWWGIIKNIGATLFNYGKATGTLGDWLTKGFLNITEGWKKASENATKAGSPFQKYLNNIKPVLSEMKNLLGDFFSWVGKTSTDPANLKMIQTLLHTIRTDLGPALGKIIDSFNKSGIGESIIKSLSAIADAIGDILAKGGGAGIKSFFGLLEELFKAVDDLVSIPGVGEVLGQIAAALGVIAALTFVGKFTGITSLIKMLTGSVGLGGAAKDAASLSKSFGAMDGMQFAGLLKMLPMLTVLATLSDQAGTSHNVKPANVKDAVKQAKDRDNPLTGGLPNSYQFKTKDEAEKFLKTGQPYNNVSFPGKNGKPEYLGQLGKPVNPNDAFEDKPGAKQPVKKSGGGGGGGAWGDTGSVAKQQKALTNLGKSLDTLTDKQKAFTASVAANGKTVDDNGKIIDSNSAAYKAEKAALDDVVKAGKDSINTATKQQAGYYAVKAATEQSVKSVYDSVTAMGYSGTAAVNYTAKLLGIPPSRVTTILADTATADNAVDKWNAHVNSIQKAITVHIGVAVDHGHINIATTGGGNLSFANGGIAKFYANGGVNKFFAVGDVQQENHIAQIAPAGSNRVWAEKETGGEAYIPLDPSKRSRSLQIWNTVGKLLNAPQLAARASQAQTSATSLIRPGVAPMMPRAISTPSISTPKVASQSAGSGNLTTGDIHINNPAPERASDSLPRAIRKVAYATNRKHS